MYFERQKSKWQLFAHATINMSIIYIYMYIYIYHIYIFHLQVRCTSKANVSMHCCHQLSQDRYSAHQLQMYVQLPTHTHTLIHSCNGCIAGSAKGYVALVFFAHIHTFSWVQEVCCNHHKSIRFVRWFADGLLMNGSVLWRFNIDKHIYWLPWRVKRDCNSLRNEVYCAKYIYIYM